MSISFKAARWAFSCLAGAGLATVLAADIDALSGRGHVLALVGMTETEISALHAALFLVTVWIVSSLRIHRLWALWRVGFGRKAMRGASGGLQPRGPKARAMTGGSVSGAGPSGNSRRPASPGNDAGHPRGPAHANDNGDAHQVLDNFRG